MIAKTKYVINYKSRNQADEKRQFGCLFFKICYNKDKAIVDKEDIS
jgi:hypothetical protein